MFGRKKKKGKTVAETSFTGQELFVNPDPSGPRARARNRARIKTCKTAYQKLKTKGMENSDAAKSILAELAFRQAKVNYEQFKRGE